MRGNENMVLCGEDNVDEVVMEVEGIIFGRDTGA